MLEVAVLAVENLTISYFHSWEASRFVRALPVLLSQGFAKPGFHQGRVLTTQDSIKPGFYQASVPPSQGSTKPGFYQARVLSSKGPTKPGPTKQGFYQASVLPYSFQGPGKYAWLIMGMGHGFAHHMTETAMR